MPDYDSEGLVTAWIMDGAGGAKRIGWSEIRRGPEPGAGFQWIHLQQLDRGHARTWLGDESGIEPSIADSLVAEETRPRCSLYEHGAFLNLRGINLKPYSLPDEMHSIRFWVEPNRVVSVRREPLSAVGDFEDALARGRAPRTPGEFVADLSMRLVDRMDTVITALAEEADELEELVLNATLSNLSAKVSEVRRVAILLRRYIAPQREALNHFSLEDAEWLSQRDRNRLREAADRVTRFAEELDSVRDRAAVIYDQMVERRAEQMNRSMLILAVVTVVFAPLTLATGLMGMNVGGIPGSDDPSGFWTVTLLATAAGLAMAAVLFRWARWI
ncbi:zinc transporter ZntB [Ancylobacter mangrovi]|uniref:zinc transporter ZntB n=1 Tax=Ancylobacter mangrovi TaxID=2972472 RepID=UPI002163B9F5|nr:zinc transporter ZntB [Ancylobacter mangrovi]MCS0501047.1 zinc transporter ZntB [Ancylobacter mangrovi]